MASPLIVAHNISKSYPGKILFQKISFAINQGDRVGLIGPNGAGKSTLLKLLAGLDQKDEGDLAFSKSLQVAYLEQDPIFQKGKTIQESILEGSFSPHEWEEMEYAQKLWEDIHEAMEVVPSLEQKVDLLSGGQKKKVSILRALMKRPTLLLMDEPTNHLDIQAIQWLEDFLLEQEISTVIITHDRAFLQRTCNRILELDRKFENGLFSVMGSYQRYCQLREEHVSSQQKLEASLKNNLRRETEWLRRGPKARTTKSQSRIDRAVDLQEKVKNLSARNRDQLIKIQAQMSQKNPKILIEALGISKSFGNQMVIPTMDFTITNSTRLGIIGRNGEGKSTLLKILTGDLNSDSGTIRRSDNLKFAWFEQNRSALNHKLSVAQNIAPDSDEIIFRGNRLHIKSYLSRFLFSPDQIDRPISQLSGGEQARLVLAKILLQEVNLLVLDEPTNDLDLSTLGILEEMIRDYPGAVILVTHDRYFLDQVVDQILAFGHGPNGQKTSEFFSGLEQWEDWYQLQSEILFEQKKELSKSPPVKPTSASPPLNDNDLTLKIESQIMQKEKQITALTEEILKIGSDDKKAQMLEKKILFLEKEIESLMEKI